MKHKTKPRKRKRYTWPAERRMKCRPVTRCKLTPELINAMRKMRKDGFVQQDIACEFGVSQGTVSMAFNRVTWKDRPRDAR